MKWILKIVQVACVCLLSACGGGGGGGGGNEAGDGSGSSNVTNPKQVSYSGQVNQAPLNQANGMRMASNAYSLLDLVVMLTNLGGAPAPWFLGVDETPIEDMEECTQGEMLTREQGSDITVQFRQCVIDDVTFDGELTFRLDVNNPTNDRHTMLIPYLSIEEAGEKFELSGEVDFEFGNTTIYTGELVARSLRQQRTFRLSNLVLQGIDNVQVAGQFFDSMDGFVSLAMEQTGKQLALTGANSSRVAIEVLASPYSPNLTYQTPVSVELQNTDLLFPVQAQLKLEQLIEWPYLANEPPASSSESSASVDRLAVLQLSGGHYLSDPLDLVNYNYELQTSGFGEECAVDEEQTTSGQIHYQFNCWGQYQLTITAFDGVHEVARTIPIDVLALPAELDPIDDVQMMQGQSLSIPLSVRNLSEDGPFSYSVVQGPSGLSVSPEGFLQGEPTPMIREASSTFNVTVQADNGRQSLVTFSIRYQSTPGDAYLVPARVQYCTSGWLSSNQAGRLMRTCPANGSHVVEHIENNRVVTAYAAPSPYSSMALVATDLLDVNRDGTAEIILIYKDRAVIIDSESYQFLEEVVYSTAFSTQSVVSFIQQSGRHRQPVALLTTGTHLHLINLANGSVTRIQSTAEVMLFGDIDRDQNVEIVLADGVVLEPIAGTAWQLQPAVNFEKFLLQDVDGDGADDLVRMVDNSHSGLGGAVSFRIAFGADRSALQSFQIDAPEGNNDDWSPRIAFVYVDGSPEARLVVRKSYSRDVYVYRWEEVGFALVDSVTLPDVFADFDGLEVYSHPEGRLMFSANNRMFVKSADSSEFLALEDQRSGLLPADQAGFFAEPDGSHTLFISRYSQKQQIKLDGVGGIQSEHLLSTSAGFGASYITRHDGNYVAAAPYSRSLTVIGDDDRRETTRHYYYGLFDVLSNTAVQEVEVPAMLEGNITSADIDSDGVLDLFVPRISVSNCSGWYVAGNPTQRQNLVCSGGLSGALVADIKAIDLDGDGISEVIHLNRLLLGGFDLQVYRLSAGRLQNWFSLTRADYGSLVTPVMGIQDVDADGVLEIVVAEKGASSTRISVLEPTGARREFTVPILLDVVPDLNYRRFNAAIVAIQNTDDAFKSTRFFEIGAVDGNIVWASQPYQGLSAKNGLYFLNRESNSSVIMAVTSAGIHRFE